MSHIYEIFYHLTFNRNRNVFFGGRCELVSLLMVVVDMWDIGYGGESIEVVEMEFYPHSFPKRERKKTHPKQNKKL